MWHRNHKFCVGCSSRPPRPYQTVCPLHWAQQLTQNAWSRVQRKCVTEGWGNPPSLNYSSPHHKSWPLNLWEANTLFCVTKRNCHPNWMINSWRIRFEFRVLFRFVAVFQLLSHVWLFVTPDSLQHARLPCPSLSPGAFSNSCLLSWWCHPTISSFVVPFSSCLQSCPASGSFLMSQFFVHHSCKVLELQLQHQSFQWIFSNDFLQDWLVWSPCSPRDSQESSPTPQFKSINSLTLSLLYGLTLTSIHDHWKNQRFDYMDLCWQSNASAF